jgi:hypothetical protein
MKNRSGETQEWQEFLPENADTMACIGGFRLNLIALPLSDLYFSSSDGQNLLC